MSHGRAVASCLTFLLAPAAAAAQEAARAIHAPRRPLPPEAASGGERRFSFIVYGDTRGRRDGKQQQYEHSLVVDSALTAIGRLEKTPYPVRFVLMSGDAVLDGRDHRHWNASFVDLVNRFTREAGVPYFLAAGNHDVTAAANLDAPDRRAGLRNYLSAVSALVPPERAARRLAGYPTYAFGFGNVFVLALDSNIAADDRQLEWARGQLAGLDRGRYRHVIALFHQPVYSAGPHGGGPRPESATVALRERYMPLFRQQRVSLIFCGHEHLFEHWVERYERDGRRYRIDQVVTGGGGAPPYAFQGRPDLREYLLAGAADKVSVQQIVRAGPDRGDNPYHYVVVQVDGDRIRWEVVGVDWGSDFAPYRSRIAEPVDTVPVVPPPPPSVARPGDAGAAR